MIPFVTCIPPLRRYAATRGVAVERPSRKIQQINFRNRRRQAKMSRRTLPVLILCCAFASQALLSTAFVAGRPSSKNIGRFLLMMLAPMKIPIVKSMSRGFAMVKNITKKFLNKRQGRTLVSKNACCTVMKIMI